MKNIEVINNHHRYRLKKGITTRAAEFVLKKNNVKDFNINIIFVSDEALLKINKEFLKHDYYTDVITFPLDNADILEGEIYISIERAKEQARDYGVKFYNEILRLVIHGTLHLCGFDDKTKVSKSEMTQLENLYLTQI